MQYPLGRYSDFSGLYEDDDEIPMEKQMGKLPEKLPITEDETGRRWTFEIRLPFSYDRDETMEEIYRRYNIYPDQQALIKQLKTAIEILCKENTIKMDVILQDAVLAVAKKMNPVTG